MGSIIIARHTRGNRKAHTACHITVKNTMIDNPSGKLIAMIIKPCCAQYIFA